MGVNTDRNIGFRRFIDGSINEWRNFEPGEQYLCNKEGMVIDGVVYHVGDALPPGALPDQVLERMWNAGEINPAPAT